jgi:hypothetical protein
MLLLIQDKLPMEGCRSGHDLKSLWIHQINLTAAIIMVLSNISKMAPNLEHLSFNKCNGLSDSADILGSHDMLKGLHLLWTTLEDAVLSCIVGRVCE